MGAIRPVPRLRARQPELAVAAAVDPRQPRADAGQLGALLLVGACGSLVAVGRTGIFVARFGARAAILCATTGNLVGFALVAAAVATTSVPLFVVGLLVNGACGALAYGTFVVAMTVFRLSGTRLIDRFGRVAALRASGVSAMLGLALFDLAPSLPLAWAGIVAWGCGAALANPIAIAAASDEPGRATARASVVTSFISMAHLTAPPTLGLLADGWGERHALLVICAAMVLSLSVAGQVRARPARARLTVGPGRS